MKKIAIQQEIIMVVDTILSKKRWCEWIASLKIRRPLPLEQQLQYACTKNFLEEYIPEVIEKTIFEQRFYMFPAKQKSNLLQISICRSPLLVDKWRSINTECFMEYVSAN